MKKCLEEYGNLVFSLSAMERYLSEKAFSSLKKTIKEGELLELKVADEVADAMKKWALENRATHFAHWFQPLTGGTAEKHNSFLTPDSSGNAILHFSGKDLVLGEADASSFPSGGLRATFEARGYTAWDPTSPAFIKKNTTGAILCIPTVFCGYHGEALDKKTPLIRSKKILAKELKRLGSFFAIEEKVEPYVTLGGEQEYFLIDRDYYFKRMDLLQTGRTLFGVVPAKHQQLEDHYFGTIKQKVLSFMQEVDDELWKLGIPAKTRHNEVAPSQFEIVPHFEELNLAVDHNMMVMDVLRTVAEKHQLACLLHEKPFQGVNGSGKHNNWSIVGTDGKNWFSSGETPLENRKFLTLLAAIIKAVDIYAGLLRSSIASAGNDHRLGAHEAPPAIISIFLGDQLCDILERIERKELKSSEVNMFKEGFDTLPFLFRDTSDRNRTSPFAFTGSKFEFRAVGSSMNMAEVNIVLNTILAESLSGICDLLEKGIELDTILSSVICEHKRVLFNGDNYSAEWQAEAGRRGLLNLKTTPEALREMISEKSLGLFEKHGVFSKRELFSHYEVSLHRYYSTIIVEANCALTMVQTMIIPAVLRFQAELSSMAEEVKQQKVVKDLLKKISAEVEALGPALEDLKQHIEGKKKEGITGKMAPLRQIVDRLESLMPYDGWPLPTYTEMMFLL